HGARTARGPSGNAPAVGTAVVRGARVAAPLSQFAVAAARRIKVSVRARVRKRSMRARVDPFVQSRIAATARVGLIVGARAPASVAAAAEYAEWRRSKSEPHRAKGAPARHPGLDRVISSVLA